MRQSRGKHNHCIDCSVGVPTILTLNLHKGFSHSGRRFVLHELREAIHGVSADIVFLQEVLGEHAGHAGRYHAWPDMAQYEFLADTIWRDYAYGKNAVYPRGHHGNALLSKYPILEFENRDVSEAGAEGRGLLYARIGLPHGNREVHAICVHLGLAEKHRSGQLAKLADIVNRELPADAAVVVAGDFNDWRNRANAMLREAAGLSEAFADASGKSARTYPARWPLIRLDRIYTRNLEVLERRVLSRRPWSHLSDHAALVAKLSFV
jgi:endonuclease/exonuclease/phosphatase family metal-dependent hydrolase